MKAKKTLIKEDINFLENPNWVVAKKPRVQDLIIKKEHGKYILRTSGESGLPSRFDKMVLYFLLHKIFKNQDNSNEVLTTRYEIAKNVLNQDENFSKTKYDRIMNGLERWKSVIIEFEGNFYEKGSHKNKNFSIIDDFYLDTKAKKILIKFNKYYIKQLKTTSFYKFIDFNEYKKLMRPVSVRLYELLLKNFTLKDVWHVNAQELAESLTLEKRHYLSQIVAALEPAIEEINENTKLAVKFDYDKKLRLCIFKKVK